MKNRSFEYVYTVFQEGSFSKAAAKLYISQPALSAAIKKVETELYGVPLFNRGVNPVTLTPAGEFYIKAGLEISEIEDRLMHTLPLPPESGEARLISEAPPTSAPTSFPAL